MDTTISKTIKQTIAQNIEQAIRFNEQGKIQPAIELFQDTIKIYPQSIKALKCLGEIYQSQNNWQEAANCYQKLVELNDRDNQSYFSLAKCFDQLREFDEVIAIYQKLTDYKVKIPAQSHLLLAKIFQQQERWQDAINCYQKAHQTNPNISDESYLKLRYLQRKQNCLNDAIETSKKLIEKNYLINHKYKIIYCPIPKNASTLFKLELLRHSEEETQSQDLTKQIHRYLKKNHTSLTLPDFSYLEREDYFKFAILREPFKRLVSAYLNKFVKIKKSPPFVKNVIANVYQYLGREPDYKQSITFSQFINYLARTEDFELNGHWRPQHTFLDLNLVKFDLLGRLENLEQVIQIIEEQTGLKIKNEKTGNKLNYGIIIDQENFHDLYPSEIRLLGKFPNADQLYTPELKDLVRIKYEEDHNLFHSCQA